MVACNCSLVVKYASILCVELVRESKRLKQEAVDAGDSMVIVIGKG